MMKKKCERVSSVFKKIQKEKKKKKKSDFIVVELISETLNAVTQDIK